MGRFIFPCILLLCLILLSCNKQNKRPEGENPKYEVFFAKGLRQYSAAIKSGLQLDKPGAGTYPISGVLNFKDFRKCFYLPAEAEPLVSPQALLFLEQKTKSSNKDEAKLASICIEIIKSKRKFNRGSEFWKCVSSGSKFVFEGEVILYHYDDSENNSEDTIPAPPTEPKPPDISPGDKLRPDEHREKKEPDKPDGK